MSRRIGEIIGHGISPIVESLDVNAIVNEIDLDEVLANVDMPKLLECVDWNAILERVDVNHLLDRVDMDRLLDNVDVDRLIERSNLEEIVSRASSGVFSEFIDMMRTRIAWIDQWGQRICRFRCFNQRPLLPPRPGRPQDDKKVWPETSGLRARKFGVAVQFRTCGGLCRMAAWIFDGFLLTFTFAVYSWIASRLAMALTNDPLWTLQQQWEWITILLFALYSLAYNFCMLACFSRTIGMWLLGLLLVSRDGHRLRPNQAFFYSFFSPLNIVLFGWVLSFLRRDGKPWNELLSCSASVYAWDVKDKPKQYADLAMSMNDYASRLPKNSKPRRRLFSSNTSTVVEQRAESVPGGNDTNIVHDSDIEQQQQQEQPPPLQQSLQQRNSSRRVVAFGI